jgi:predicted GNAT superfamily acetyltransferase
MSDNASSERQQIEVCPLRNVREMKICVALQKCIWGCSDLEVVPEEIFVVAAKAGGQVLAAFKAEVAVGFAVAFVALSGSEVYLHSHMVCVLPEYQGRGVGRLLKLAQRDDAMTKGIDLIEWTFDPLQLKNAHFNIARLGAIVRNYLPDLYGRTSSPLHAGLPTDRLLAEWHLSSDRVKDRLNGRPYVPGSECERIGIPAAIREMCSTQIQEVQGIQSQIRLRFERLFSEGFAVVDFELNRDQGIYGLEPCEDWGIYHPEGHEG